MNQGKKSGVRVRKQGEKRKGDLQGKQRADDVRYTE